MYIHKIIIDMISLVFIMIITVVINKGNGLVSKSTGRDIQLDDTASSQPETPNYESPSLSVWETPCGPGSSTP